MRANTSTFYMGSAGELHLSLLTTMPEEDILWPFARFFVYYYILLPLCGELWQLSVLCCDASGEPGLDWMDHQMIDTRPLGSAQRVYLFLDFCIPDTWKKVQVVCAKKLNPWYSNVSKAGCNLMIGSMFENPNALN